MNGILQIIVLQEVGVARVVGEGGSRARLGRDVTALRSLTRTADGPAEWLMDVVYLSREGVVSLVVQGGML